MFLIIRKADNTVIFTSTKADVNPYGLELDDMIVADVDSVEAVPFTGTLPADFEPGKYKFQDDGSFAADPEFEKRLPPERKIELLENKLAEAEAKNQRLQEQITMMNNDTLAFMDFVMQTIAPQ